MQTSVQDLSPAIQGMPADAGFRDIVSRTPGANVKQVTTITLSGVPNASAAYTVTVQGVPASYTTDASPTLQELYDGLIAALQGNAYIHNKTVVVTGNGSTVMTLTAVEAGVPFTAAETADPGNNMVLATPTPNVTGNPIPFGFGLAQSLTNAAQAVLPSATGFLFAGVAVHKQKAQQNAVEAARYEAGESVSVLKKGRIWVWSEQAVGPGDPVYLRHTANGANVPGQFRKDADTARADQITTGARWASITTGAGLALLEVNIP